MKVVYFILFLFISFSVFSFDENIKFDLSYEKGFLKILYHTIRIGETGSLFNYISQGGQEILFPFERYAADLYLFGANKISFLYQPLTLNTESHFYEDVIIDGLTFPAGVNASMKYGFPFYRTTYAYQFKLAPFLELGAGLALQLRNASIIFSSADGSILTSSQNLGPVPALHINLKYNDKGGFFAYFEATGIYASSAIINGANFAFEGSLLDTSLRAGMNLKTLASAFINIRFVGGTAKGTSQYPNEKWSESRERFTENYLALLCLSLGVKLDI